MLYPRTLEEIQYCRIVNNSTILVRNIRNIFLLIVCYYIIYSNQLVDVFLLDKSKMVNNVSPNVNNDFACLYLVSKSMQLSSWRCGLWSPYKVLGIHYNSLDKFVNFRPEISRSLVGRPGYKSIFFCRSVDQALNVCGTDHTPLLLKPLVYQ